jgi:zinc protease
MKLFIFLFFLIFPFQTYGQTEERQKTFNAEYATLDNGMQVVVIPNHRVPVVTHMVWYKAGASDEPAGKSGIAHFLEHLMFKGTNTYKPGEFSRIIKGLGGNDNAFTSQNYTAYFQSIASGHLETVMEMEADRMRGLSPPKEEVASERLVVLEERRQRTDNDPKAHFYEQISHTLFANHAYGIPVIGWLHEIKDLNWEDAKAFYDLWYAPNNAILVVSGDITMDQLLPIAKRIYGPIAPREIKKKITTSVPPLPSNYHLVLEHPLIHQPNLSIVFLAPSFIKNKKAALALHVLEEAISGTPTTRLYKSLVVEQKIATSVAFRYQDYMLGDTPIWIKGTPAENISLEELEKAIFKELKKLQEHGVTEQEVSEAKKRLIDSAVFERDSLSGPAMIFGHSLVNGATIDDVEYWTYDIEAVTLEDINNVINQYLNPEQMENRPYITGYLLPEKDKNKEQINE